MAGCCVARHAELLGEVATAIHAAVLGWDEPASEDLRVAWWDGQAILSWVLPACDSESAMRR